MNKVGVRCVVKGVLAAVIAVFFCIPLSAQQPGSYFTFGNEKMDRGKLIHVQNANSIFIAGETEDLDSPNKSLFVTNVTAEGKVNWYKTYGGDIPYAVNGWSKTDDGGFIVSAEQYYVNDKETLYLVKLDDEGGLQWSKLFDEGGNEVEGLSIAATKDGGFIVTGLIKMRSVVSSVFFTMKQEKQYLYILKTDKNGNKEWSKKFNDEEGGVATGNKVVETEKGYLIGGIMGIVNGQNPEDKNTDMLLLQIDLKGNFVWSKRLGGAKNETIKNIALIDSDVFVVGATTSAGEGKSDMFLARLNSKGDLKWIKTYGGIGHENAGVITELDKNTLLMAGETNSFGNGSYDVVFITLNKDGQVIDSETFGQENHDELGSAVVDGNNVYVTGFSFISSGQKSAQAYLLSFDWSNKKKACFFKPAGGISKDFSSSFLTKNFEKKLLSDVFPVPEKTDVPLYKTVLKNTPMTVEPFCK